MPSFAVRVTKDYTVFCAGHFITYEGDKCESLHGHNYRATAQVEGPLNSNAYVFDFVILKRLLRQICDRLDHKTLLPQYNPLLTVKEDGDSVLAQYREKRYVFPKDDILLLPIVNTTAEMLAQYITDELAAAFRAQNVTGLTALEIEVEESFGQSAICRKPLEN